MRIFELLDPSQINSSTPTTGSMPTATAPMTNPLTSQASPSPTSPPMQTAGIGSTIKNFLTHPQPIGGTTAPQPSPGMAPQPATPTPTTPAPTAGGGNIINRAMGGTFVGDLERGLANRPASTAPQPK